MRILETIGLTFIIVGIIYILNVLVVGVLELFPLISEHQLKLICGIFLCYIGFYILRRTKID